MKENWRPSKLELRIQEFARSNASKQLLQIPYDDFARAARQYVRWEAFSLWIRAVLAFEHTVPAVVQKALRQHCASFLTRNDPLAESAALPLRLDEWISGRKLFVKARREGWFEAVLFYAVRDPKLKYVYAYREQCEHDWANKRSRDYPEFALWFQSACDCARFPASAGRLAKAVGSYLDWLALAYWLEPLLESDCGIRSRLFEELKATNRKFRELLESDEWCAVTTRFHVMSWVENRYFCKARADNWIESLRRYAQNHPRCVRIAEYARRSGAQQPQGSLEQYPSFTDWCRDAENFVERRLD